MSIWFLPGRHGTPTGFRAQWFSNHVGARPLFLDPEKPFDWFCDDLKRRISEQGKPECLIGVSSGAALIWKLLHERAWDGPTVLLSPALRRYMQPLVTPPVGHGIVFHGERDSVVAIEDSVTAIAGSESVFSWSDVRMKSTLSRVFSLTHVCQTDSSRWASSCCSNPDESRVLRPPLISFAALCCVLPLENSLGGTLELNAGMKRVELTEYLEILKDPSGKLSIDDVRIRGEFSPLNASTLNLGITSDACWVRSRIRNNSDDEDWVLEVAYPPLDFIDLYVESEDGTLISTSVETAYRSRSGMCHFETLTLKSRYHPTRR